MIINHEHVGEGRGLLLFGVGGCWGSILQSHWTFVKLLCNVGGWVFIKWGKGWKGGFLFLGLFSVLGVLGQFYIQYEKLT